MIYHRTLLASFVSLFFLVGNTMAQENKDTADSISVGGRSLVILQPQEGYLRCDGIDAIWDKFYNSMLPASNRLLAFYGPPEQQAAIRDGTYASASRNFTIQSIRAIEFQEFGTAAFTELKTQMREELASMKESLDAEVKKAIADGNSRVTKDFGADPGISISDTAMLGIFQDNETSLGFTMMVSGGSASPKSEEKSKSVVAGLMVPVNGRVLMLYSTMEYHGNTDRLEAERSVKAWADAIVAANPIVKGGETAGRGFFDGGGRAAAIGAGVGLVYGLFMVVKKRLTR